MDLTGRTIANRYQVSRQLGEGGMSFVYHAMDTVNHQPVVIKLMKSKIASIYLDDLIRFKREVEVASGFNHPNIIKIFGAGEYEAIPYIVMELLAGKSLADLLGEGKRFTVETTVRIIEQLAETLNYIHRCGIIHRDIKPGNIYLTGGESKTQIKLLDFGVSHIIELGAIKDRELIAGTFGYMSPEVTGILNRKIDERSDLYSLGVVFYQLLTGELPFQGKEVKQILHQQAALVPVHPGKLNPKVPVILDEIIMRLLSKEPDQRYQSASGLLYDFNLYLQGEMDFTVGANDQHKKLTYQTTSLIGRAKETDKIKELLEQAGKGRGTICYITGEAGIGKSRLVEEIRADVYKQNGFFIKGRCLNHQNKTPYQPFRDAIDEYINWFEKTDPETMEQEITRFRNSLGELGQIVIQLNSRLTKVIGPTKQLVPIDQERENKRFLMVLSSFICQLIENGRPYVLYLDDLQWADEGTLDLLAEITWKIRDSNLLILATCRDGEPGSERNIERITSKTRETDINLETIQLKSLDYDQINSLITDIFGAKEALTSNLIDYILEKSCGNPFFAVNIIRELVENHALFWRETRLEVDWDRVQQIPVSSSIVDIILRRIENLLPEQVDILCKAAVIGREFDVILLIKLSNLSKEHTVAMVDEFIALQLLDKGLERGRLLFAHDRIRDAFYYQLNDIQKREIHLEIARTIEALSDQNPDKFIFELAHHYIEGEDHQKALEYVWPAANKAKASYANEDAVRYYRKTIELMENKGEKDNSQWKQAYQELMEIYVMIGLTDEAISLSQILLPLINEPLSRAKIHQKVGRAYYRKGEWAKSEDNFRKGLALLDYKIPRNAIKVLFSLVREIIIHALHNGKRAIFSYRDLKPVQEADREIVSTCIYLTWLYSMSDIKKYVNLTLQMVNLAETRIGRSRELGIFSCSYALIYACLSFFKTSIKLHKKALKMLLELGDEWALAMSYELLGYTYCWKGEHSNGVRYLESSYEKFQKIGDLYEMASVVINLGVSHLRTSNYPKALKYTRADAEYSRQQKDAFGIAFSSIYSGFIHIETGDYSIAGEMIQKGFKIGDEINNMFLRCLANLASGYLALENNLFDQAIYHLEQAKKIDEENMLLEEYVLPIYPLLAEAYLKKVQEQSKGSVSSLAERKKIRMLCNHALKKTGAWPNHYGSALRVAANCCYFLGKPRKAGKYFRKAIEHCETIRLKYETGKCYLEYGNFLNSLKRGNEASSNRLRAYLIFKEIGAAFYIKKCEDWCDPAQEKTITNELTARNRLASERRQNAIITTGRYISSILDINILLEKIMDSAIELVGAERGILLLYPEAGDRKLETKVARKIKAHEIDPKSIHISRNIISKVEKEQLPLIVMDALADDTLKNQTSVVLSGIKSVICTPIMLKGEMIGIIYLDNSLVKGLFNEEDLEVLDLIASQAGVSIENARLCQSLEQRVAERTGQLKITNQELNLKNAELSAVNEQLKEHAAMVAELATIKERNRVAVDVHDTIGHTMTLLLKLLEVCKIICWKDPLKTEKELANAINLTRDGLKEVRRSISGLMPERLAANDLPVALERLIASYASSGVAIDFMLEGTASLPDVTYSDVIYRTCQEALTNALRHGKAKNVAVILKFNHDKIKLYIVDDGCGCKEVKKGIGLSGMEKRVKGLNGNFKYSSDGETGFNIQVEIPLEASIAYDSSIDCR